MIQALDSDEDADLTIDEDQAAEAEVLPTKEGSLELEGSETMSVGMAVAGIVREDMVGTLQPPSVREANDQAFGGVTAEAECCHPLSSGVAEAGSSDVLEKSSQPADGFASCQEGFPSEGVSPERGEDHHHSAEEELGRRGSEEVCDETQIEDTEYGVSTEALVASGEENVNVRNVEKGPVTFSKVEPVVTVDGGSSTKDGVYNSALDGVDHNTERTRRNSAGSGTGGDARRARAAAAAERRRVGSEPPLPCFDGGKGYIGGDKGGEGNAVPPTAKTSGEGLKGEGEDLAVALSAAREREDSLTARLLMAEELLVERERQLESTNISMAEIMQGGGRGDASAAAAVEVSKLEGILEAERKKAKTLSEAVKGWERRAEEFEEKDKMLQVGWGWGWGGSGGSGTLAKGIGK